MTNPTQPPAPIIRLLPSASRRYAVRSARSALRTVAVAGSLLELSAFIGDLEEELFVQNFLLYYIDLNDRLNSASQWCKESEPSLTTFPARMFTWERRKSLSI